MTAFWNDNEFPLGYLITFRTYGTWLPGDERGSIDRYNNVYRGPRVPPNPILEQQARSKLKSEPLILNAIKRKAVKDAIVEVCENRDWLLRAINVRTNHAHTVVSIGLLKPRRALNAFKAYGTRKLREQGLWEYEHSPWAESGSKRWLWSELASSTLATMLSTVKVTIYATLTNWIRDDVDRHFVRIERRTTC